MLDEVEPVLAKVFDLISALIGMVECVICFIRDGRAFGGSKIGVFNDLKRINRRTKLYIAMEHVAQFGVGTRRSVQSGDFLINLGLPVVSHNYSFVGNPSVGVTFLSLTVCFSTCSRFSSKATWSVHRIPRTLRDASI